MDLGPVPSEIASSKIGIGALESAAGLSVIRAECNEKRQRTQFEEENASGT